MKDARSENTKGNNLVKQYVVIQWNHFGYGRCSDPRQKIFRQQELGLFAGLIVEGAGAELHAAGELIYTLNTIRMLRLLSQEVSLQGAEKRRI